jgi:hypothetical protein
LCYIKTDGDEKRECFQPFVKILVSSGGWTSRRKYWLFYPLSSVFPEILFFRQEFSAADVFAVMRDIQHGGFR